MRDVAALAGVSTKTVSNVVTGAVGVRPDTQERVAAAMRELDFVPNLSARGLRNGRTGMIAVALPDLSTAYSAELLHLLVEAAHRRGFAVQVEETAAEPERERELLSRAHSHLIDGLILNPIRLEDTAITRTANLPPVVLIGEVEQHLTDGVQVDSRAAAAAITAHAIGRGARRIAVIGGDETHPEFSTATNRLRLAGVREAIAAAGLPHDIRREIAPHLWTMAGAAEATEHLLASGVGFDAVVAFTDTMAVGAMHALRSHGIRIPEDVLVTGFDNGELSRFSAPPLTTVDLDLPAFTETAMAMLADRIATPSGRPRIVHTPFRVVERTSTAAMPAGYRAD